MPNEPVSIGREARMIWPAGITAADLHAAIDWLTVCITTRELDPGERRSLARVRDAIRNEHGNRKRAAITAATGGRRQRRRNVQ